MVSEICFKVSGREKGAEGIDKMRSGHVLVIAESVLIGTYGVCLLVKEFLYV